MAARDYGRRFPSSDKLCSLYTGAIEPSNKERKSKVAHSLPPNVKVTSIQPGENLSQMLADGVIDAIFSATEPSSFDTSPNII
jgi:4,5-dihydroxyphthalate decarboxylase